jgi:hypothetical protein
MKGLAIATKSMVRCYSSLRGASKVEGEALLLQQMYRIATAADELSSADVNVHEDALYNVDWRQDALYAVAALRRDGRLQ